MAVGYSEGAREEGRVDRQLTADITLSDLYSPSLRTHLCSFLLIYNKFCD
jgi:hypothetical protein